MPLEVEFWLAMISHSKQLQRSQLLLAAQITNRIESQLEFELDLLEYMRQKHLSIKLVRQISLDKDPIALCSLQFGSSRKTNKYVHFVSCVSCVSCLN